MGKLGVEYHLVAITEIFDFTKEIIKPPHCFASDISEVGRSISICGSREIIDGGYHREAVYWIVATYSRRLAILHNDVSRDERENYAAGVHELLADLGTTSFADLQERSQRTREFLQRVSDVVEAIMDANAEIEE